MQQAKKLLIKGIKSKLITSGEDLMAAIYKALKNCKIQEKDVLIVSSKVVAVTQGRVRHAPDTRAFDNLVQKEADKVLGGPVTLTLKDGILIPWAGIDRSNVEKGNAVLWPEKPFRAAEQIRAALCRKNRIKRFGVIISDSHCVPLRRGVTGIAIGYAGFKGVKDLRGKKDLFGNRLKVTQQSLADMLAAAAHLVTGEAAERIPFALVRNAPVEFTSKHVNPKEAVISQRECLFSPLYGKRLY